jgi:NADH-quinone oxidoreductase subunit N
MLLATIGMLLMVSTENLLVIFLGLELTSLSLYVLTAFHKENPASAEAALEVFPVRERRGRLCTCSGSACSTD